MVIDLCLPFYSTAVPWENDFDWNAFNYTPLVVGLVPLGVGLAWVLGANKRYTGPIRQIEFDEGVGIGGEAGEPATPPPPAAPASAARLRTVERGGRRHEGAPALVLGRAPGVVAPRLDRAVDRQQLGGLGSEPITPAPTAASAAAPSTVASAPAASTGAPIASAWSWSRAARW